MMKKSPYHMKSERKKYKNWLKMPFLANFKFNAFIKNKKRRKKKKLYNKAWITLKKWRKKWQVDLSQVRKSALIFMGHPDEEIKCPNVNVETYFKIEIKL